jgi:hypothetical protein
LSPRLPSISESLSLSGGGVIVAGQLLVMKRCLAGLCRVARWRRSPLPGGRRIKMLPADLRANNVLQAAGNLNFRFTHAIRKR